MWKLKIGEGHGPWVTTTNNHIGRQYWEFDPHAGTPQERAQIERVRHEFNKNRFQTKQSADLLMRMQLTKENTCGEIPFPAAVKVKDTEDLTEEAVTATLRRAISFYSTIQAHDGHWPSESAGPLFFLPPLVIVLYITGAISATLSLEHQKEIIRYIYNHQNTDGGWGIHIEGRSTMFGSILNYVALRLLGEGNEDGEDGDVARGRKWILDHGGAVAIPSWGKFWLTVLGTHEWSGCNPVPPEFWLIPKFSPIHPGHMLSYARLVYMPMSYLYGKRFVSTPLTGLVQSLRQELYTQPYHEINWNKARTTCAKEDLYYPHPLVQDMLWGFLHNVVEPLMIRWPFNMLREKAMNIAMDHIHYEDKNSRYFSLGCIEKVLCMLACWVEDPNSEAYKFHLARIPDFLWIAEDGMKMQSFGCQLWDAAFAIQAIISSGLADEYGLTLRKAHHFVKASQVQQNPCGNFTEMYRYKAKGAWTFSIQDQGWPVLDCTAEGLKVALLLSQISPELVGAKIETNRLFDAVDITLTFQSSNGGFAVWEPAKAFRWLEKFNPIEFFEDALIEREYVECTASAIKALSLFTTLHPQHRKEEIQSCISRGVRYIEEQQNSDGSWYGSWGICYTYGTWLAVDGLVGCGKRYHNSLALRRACHFLLSKQLPCGGWGESYLSCQNKMYTNLQGNRSNLVQTSWALLALIYAGQAEIDQAPIDRGFRLLINSQMDDGDFPQQEVTGAFMRNLELHYSSYRDIFPIWALGEYRRHVLLPRHSFSITNQPSQT